MEALRRVLLQRYEEQDGYHNQSDNNKLAEN